MSGVRDTDRLTDVQRARIADAYRGGTSIRDLASRFGVGLRVIRATLSAAGVTIRTGRGGL